jgi:hypothetical protein
MVARPSLCPRDKRVDARRIGFSFLCSDPQACQVPTRSGEAMVQEVHSSKGRWAKGGVVQARGSKDDGSVNIWIV